VQLQEELKDQDRAIEPVKEVPPVERKKKKTKEDMMNEPMPVFDCMYCVRDGARVLKTVSENLLKEKYSQEVVLRHHRAHK
jgi:hypothetical protein